MTIYEIKRDLCKHARFKDNLLNTRIITCTSPYVLKISLLQYIGDLAVTSVKGQHLNNQTCLKLTRTRHSF